MVASLKFKGVVMQTGNRDLWALLCTATGMLLGGAAAAHAPALAASHNDVLQVFAIAGSTILGGLVSGGGYIFAQPESRRAGQSVLWRHKKFWPGQGSLARSHVRTLHAEENSIDQ